MALNILGLTDAVQSHAGASGYFETVNGHEPKNAPAAGGLTAAVWADRVTALRSSSLNSVSVLLVFNVRIYGSAQSEPADAIDPNMLAAVDALCAAYSGDFTLGGLVRSVDLLGSNGTPLSVQAGYLSQDGSLYRVMTITVPCIVNDLWEEVA
ncbi:hypothetical protein PV755_45415 [Streptomyces caniscabiei]|uniref:Uncharacterized protein n=1 Tax=Streptomyces caniscabiei TaxID=2746961 RepID=A0A927QEK2_9ACTN|nr:hypothetical protein [Streptomyces caniscabiei]MBD9723446.1 hypothetical protein [Streptomyces caniscabiei]MDX3516056.1 hypothetical protein [Streptomyces caniscabiei]MDX3725138.1 hypothetical protein [Streptomyces caniscabiei]WEO27016.1 hypothetical protein IHE65_29815 [Streptomyces caniscabiei]